MAVVEPYAPCPCGSGEKFKWCCHKVESYAERAVKLAENGQPDVALSVLDEGLRKSPDNPWLAIRKAIILTRRGEPGKAREALGRVVQKKPRHVGAQIFLVRLALQEEGPTAGAGQLQQALAAFPPEQRAGFWMMAELIGSILVESGHVPAGLAHLELANALTPDEEESTPAQSQKVVESNPGISPWLRNPYDLSDVPEGLDEARAKRFEEALDWADRGLWASAAAAFDTLSAEGTPESDRNLGLCRLFLGDEPGAVEALRRHTRWVGANPETVDLEALCQIIDPIPEDQKVELVQWSWNLHDRHALLAALRAEDRVEDEGTVELDPDATNPTEAEAFVLLDRVPASGVTPAGPEDLPSVESRVYVTRDRVILEGFDGGRLDAQAERLRAIGGASIPPAQPTTEVVGETTRPALAMRTEWFLPEGLAPEVTKRLFLEERRRAIFQVWPEIPEPYLGGRTPRQAARDGDAALPLRAALCELEQSFQSYQESLDFDALRRELGVEVEPEIDPATVEIEGVHIARLHRILADRLDDARLVELFDRAHRYQMRQGIENAARVLVDRPHLLDREGGPKRLTVYSNLANLALSRDARDEAFDWIRKGRESVPGGVGTTGPVAASWDMLAIRLSSRFDPPERWVPELAATMDRHKDRESSSVVLTGLMDIGLIQVLPKPDSPGEVMIDSRPLQAMLSRYGPRITTASGELGISATKGRLWTPGSEPVGSPGGIWTPGQPPAGGSAEGEKPSKLII